MLTGEQIDEKCNFIMCNLACSAEQCHNLEVATRDQTVSQLWFDYRKGRVMGTKAHDVLVRRDTTNEGKARLIYSISQEEHHQNFSCRQSGLVIDHRNLCLGASADGIVCCECCGEGVIEIKCPFTHKHHTVSEAACIDKSFCLLPDLSLKTGHRYYTQVQLQMRVNKVSYCDFVVYTEPREPCIHITRVCYDAAFCNKLVDTCLSYWRELVLPELVSGRLANKQLCVPDEPELAVTAVWCICSQPEYGKMIKCDNVACKIEWFHYACVNVKRKPVGKWFCPSCKD